MTCLRRAGIIARDGEEIGEESSPGERAVCSRHEPKAAVAVTDVVLRVAPPVFSALSSALSWKVLATTTAAAQLSCLPMIFPFLPSEGEDTDMGGVTLRAKQLQQGLILVCAAQGCLAITQTLFGDVLGGSIGIVVSTVGLCTTMPRGVRLLPTYATSSFLNGALSSLAVMERVPFLPWPLFSYSQPMVVNAVHLVLLTQPALAFSGAALSYMYLKELRSISAADFATDFGQGRDGTEQADAAGRGAALSTWQPFEGTAYRLVPEGAKEAKKVDE